MQGKAKNRKKLIIEGFEYMRAYGDGYTKTTKPGLGLVTVGGLANEETYEFKISQKCADQCPSRPGPNMSTKVWEALTFEISEKIQILTNY